MGIKQTSQAAIPAGPHKGVIIGAELTTRVFDSAKGPEPVVEITIQPAWKQPDTNAETLPVTASFTPKLNTLSSLSKFLKRLDVKVPEGEEWNPESIIGREVAFTAQRTDKDFVRVLKDTIRAA